MRIQTVIPIGPANCHKCHAPITGTAKRVCLPTGARVYCESCAAAGMANLRLLMDKLYLPDAEFEAFLLEE